MIYYNTIIGKYFILMVKFLWVFFLSRIFTRFFLNKDSGSQVFQTNSMIGMKGWCLIYS